MGKFSKYSDFGSQFNWVTPILFHRFSMEFVDLPMAKPWTARLIKQQAGYGHKTIIFNSYLAIQL